MRETSRGRDKKLYVKNNPKTYSCYEIIGEDMKNDPESMWGWFETEGSFDWEVAERCGVDPERLVFWEMSDDGAEAGLDILEMLLRNMGADLNGVVVNSVAGLTPRKELEGQMDKIDVGTQAKMMSKLMRKITALVAKNKIPVIFINQVRDKIDLFGGTTTTGGRALVFFASQRVEFRKKKTEASDGVRAEEYMKINIKIHKNRFAKGNPFVETQIFGRYGSGTDVTMEILELACDPDIAIIEKGAGGRYRYVTLGGEELKWHGATKLMDFVNDNPWFFEELQSRLTGSHIDSKISAMSQEEVAAIEAAAKDIEAEISQIENDESEEKGA